MSGGLCGKVPVGCLRIVAIAAVVRDGVRAVPSLVIRVVSMNLVCVYICVYIADFDSCKNRL